jgi:cytidylate kinase
MKNVILNLSHPLGACVEDTLRQHLLSKETGLPFVTLSRQAGIAGHTVAQMLVERLNVVDPGRRPWTYWDRELVEKVAADQHLPLHEVEALEEHKEWSWLRELLQNVSLSDKRDFHDEFVVYRRVAQTVRELAMNGRVVLVGRGSTYLTHKLPHGVHIRLVAPLAYRIESTAKSEGLSHQEAEKVVRDLDASRMAFMRRYFPSDVLNLEMLTAGLNAAELSLEQIVECILPMLNLHLHVAVPHAPA